MRARLLEHFGPILFGDRGDVPGWVLILLMSAGLVVAIWGVARDRLVAIVSSALSIVCGGIGC
jgi:hypothetical protein